MRNAEQVMELHRGLRELDDLARTAASTSDAHPDSEIIRRIEETLAKASQILRETTSDSSEKESRWLQPTNDLIALQLRLHAARAGSSGALGVSARQELLKLADDAVRLAISVRTSALMFSRVPPTRRTMLAAVILLAGVVTLFVLGVASPDNPRREGSGAGNANLAIAKDAFAKARGFHARATLLSTTAESTGVALMDLSLAQGALHTTVGALLSAVQAYDRAKLPDARRLYLVVAPLHHGTLYVDSLMRRPVAPGVAASNLRALLAAQSRALVVADTLLSLAVPARMDWRPSFLNQRLLWSLVLGAVVLASLGALASILVWRFSGQSVDLSTLTGRLLSDSGGASVGGVLALAVGAIALPAGAVAAGNYLGSVQPTPGAQVAAEAAPAADPDTTGRRPRLALDADLRLRPAAVELPVLFRVVQGPGAQVIRVDADTSLRTALRDQRESLAAAKAILDSLNTRLRVPDDRPEDE
jgi:hypothetical protein